MTPAARLQAAIEILDEVIASAVNDGPPADSIVTRYFKTRRYAGSKDRRAVRELVFRAIRTVAERPETGRAAVLALAQDDPSLLELFGEPRGPDQHVDGERVAEAGVVPAWLGSELSPLVSEEEWNALLAAGSSRKRRSGEPRRSRHPVRGSAGYIDQPVGDPASG